MVNTDHHDNVTVLLNEQRALNAAYLEDVKEVKIDKPDSRFMTASEREKAEQEYKDEQKRLKTYNAALKEKRKTELPTLYEPLVLNCDLLFALAEEIGISKSDKREIEAILLTINNGERCEELIFRFEVVEYEKKWWIFEDKVVFGEV